MTTVEAALKTVETSSNSSWVVLSRDANDHPEIAGKGSTIADLRSQLKAAKGPIVGVLKANGSSVPFRYGTKSKEFITSHEVKALFKQNSPAVVITNVDTDITDEGLSPKLPGLPSKLSNQPELTRAASSESVTSVTSLSPEEKEEEIKQAQKRLEEINLSAQRKNEEAIRYKKAQEAEELKRKQEAEQNQKEQSEIQQFKFKLAQNKPDVAFEGWLSFHRVNSTIWHRRWVLLKKPGDIVIKAESASQTLFNANISKSVIEDAEAETGMRNSVSIQAPGQEKLYLLADNRSEYHEVFAVLQYLA
ncbi:hypothetical protein HDU97_006693 [Phlyctochytrium planicorne]|nr:hypothetical protein HDU97_006693 [Phlyctochytrium planicorne]